jgi:hypothetical protein
VLKKIGASAASPCAVHVTTPGEALLMVTVAEVGVLPTMLGVLIVGDVANTADPEPVSSVSAEARLALEKVPRSLSR